MESLSLKHRVASLEQLVELTEHKVSEELLGRARLVAKHVDSRLTFSEDHTVVALAGATGSGKSSLFNALTQTTLAQAGVKRPMTTKAMAACWGRLAPNDLLDWLQVPDRHLITGGHSNLDGLVLIDFPDHDSTEVSHKIEVDRLIELVDMMVWVVDPQKYADHVLHHNYLVPLKQHSEVMLVVLNQADLLTPSELESCLSHLRELLDSEGLSATPIMVSSALKGLGVGQLHELLSRRVAEKKMALQRLDSDLIQIGQEFAEYISVDPVLGVKPDRVADLVDKLSEAARVDEVCDIVRKSALRQGNLATGWPAVNWVSKFNSDPAHSLSLLNSLHGDKQSHPQVVVGQATSLSGGSQVTKAKIGLAVRELADEAATGLPASWQGNLRLAALSNEVKLADRLDGTLAAADFGLAQKSGWWTAIKVLQWLLFGLFTAGVLWHVGNLVLTLTGGSKLSNFVEFRGLPLATWLIIVCGVSGIVLAGICRFVVGWLTSWRVKKVRKQLTESIADLVNEFVVRPMENELDTYRLVQQLVAKIAAH